MIKITILLSINFDYYNKKVYNIHILHYDDTNRIECLEATHCTGNDQPNSNKYKYDYGLTIIISIIIFFKKNYMLVDINYPNSPSGGRVNRGSFTTFVGSLLA